MFRTTCDKRVTTSPPAGPSTSKPQHPEMPAGKPDCPKPERAKPAHCATTARQPLVNLLDALSKRNDYRQIVVQKGEMVVSLNRSANP